MKKVISFITTASHKVGLGHLVRSLSLAQMLTHNFDINFIVATENDSVINMVKASAFPVVQLGGINYINNPDHILSFLKQTDIAVLDFYTLTEELQLSIKHQNIKLVCIDDLHKLHFYADVVLNVSNSINKSNYVCENYTKLLLGTDYVLLRPVFLQCAAAPARKIEQITSIFVNMGGADENNNTLKLLKAIIATDKIKQIHIVIGLVNPYKTDIENYINNLNTGFDVKIHSNIDGAAMKDVLLESQLAICPASGISMELCAVGIGMITGYTANNQKDLLKGLIDNKCAVNLDDINLLNEEKVNRVIQELIHQPSVINEMIFNQKKLIDGRSGDRMREIFELL